MDIALNSPRDVDEEYSIKQVVMNILETNIGELTFPDYEGFGSDFTSLERENSVSDDEMKEIITIALDEVIANGLVDSVSSVYQIKEDDKTKLGISLVKGNQTLNILI